MLAEGGSIYNSARHEELFSAWKNCDLNEHTIRSRYSPTPISISIRGYLIHATFPQNGPKYRYWTNPMILETLLVSRLGPEVRNVLSCSRILRNVAQKKFRPKGGNDPTFGCRAAGALVVPAIWPLRPGSETDQFGIPD